MSVGFLKEIDGFEIAIEVRANIIPGITWVMDILVRPEIGKGYFTRRWINVGEGVEDVAKETNFDLQ